MNALRAVIVVALLLIIAGCLQPASPFLNFTTAPCISGIDPYIQPPAEILNQSWVNERTLSVEAYLKTWCGGAEIRGDYAFQEDQLVLYYNVTSRGPVTTCLCTHRLVYTISNIQRRNYTITIQGR